MSQRKFPDDSSGLVHGPDGPVRRTRAHTVKGFVEPVEVLYRAGRSKAFMDEESAWLNGGAFLEDE